MLAKYVLHIDFAYFIYTYMLRKTIYVQSENKILRYILMPSHRINCLKPLTNVHCLVIVMFITPYVIAVYDSPTNRKPFILHVS